MVLGSTSWWCVGYRSWGALTAGLLTVLGLWLMWRTVSGDRTVPGHPFHMILAAPAGILTWHFVRHSLLAPPPAPGALAGALDLSMLYHLAILAGLVLLTQSLLPGDSGGMAVVAACGAAMMVGPIVAVAWGQTVETRSALALLGFAGVAVWLSLLWGGAPRVLPRRVLWPACMAIGTGSAAVFAWAAPCAAVWAGIVVGVALVAGGAVFPRRRVVLLGVGGVLAVGGLGLLGMLGGPVVGVDLPAATCIGSGEEAFVRLSTASSGLAVLVSVVGWCGCAWILVGACVCTVRLLQQSARYGVDRGRAVVWVAAAGLSGSAMLAGGGAFIPTASLAVAFT